LVDWFVPAPKVSSDEIGATTRTKKEVELKRIVFLIIASLMVLGLVLPGCTTPTPPTPPSEVIYNFTDGIINVAICGDAAVDNGARKLAADLACAAINGAGGVNIGGNFLNITTVAVDTKELTTYPDGSWGHTALLAVIDSVDFACGGYRTEALENYMDVAMDAHKIFFDCGAATEILCHRVVTNYNKYKYFFKTTPYNEYFLAKGVLKLLGSTARVLRAALNLSATATLKSVIIAEDLTWARDQQAPLIAAGLGALNISNQHTYIVDAYTAAPTINAFADIVTQAYDPDIIIPLYSGSQGATYAGYQYNYNALNYTNDMSIGINVVSQRGSYWTGVGTNLSSPPPAGPYVKDSVILDTYAEGINQTSLTSAFFTTYKLYAGDYPSYVASSYDMIFTLKSVLQGVGYVEGGNAKAKANDMIAFMENAANAILTTTGYPCVYPVAASTFFGSPTLNSTQVSAIYNLTSYGWTYSIGQWVTPPHTAHDLAYGVGRATGLGAQWQWDGALWKKLGIWPRVEALNLVDQYGNWSFAYSGTVNISIPTYLD
jgi:branched-chain amino acid transport system substrate-binding protein